ncbi:hypothetical protein KBZ21_40535, partial [Streptomyces sp. A73]|nr:hypothetical protein [Streptomyces sp. A73]
VAASWNIRKSLRINPEAKGEQTAAETGLLEKSLGKAKAKLRRHQCHHQSAAAVRHFHAH